VTDETETEILYEGPMDFVFHGRDTKAWRWFLNGQEVIVEVTGTAMEADPDALPERTRDAIATSGESEILRMREWAIPNPHIVLTTEDV
jgi:hypothetical protein